MAKKLLIVEDSDDVRRLLRMTFDSVEYAIHEAANGTDAVRIAREILPDVIVMDVTMPGAIDGLRACEIIKSDDRLQSSFVVMVTARGRAQDLERGYAAGADAYLVKPFSPMRLTDVIASRARDPGASGIARPASIQNKENR